MKRKTAHTFLLFAWLLVAAGCSQEQPTGPPGGWQSADNRWWQSEVDTSRALRNLETLKAMEVGQESGSFTQAVQEEFLPLYRNRPSIVDSLFEAYVRPVAEEADRGDFEAAVDRVRKEGYETLREHFQEPQVALELGTDVPVVYPDSLRQAGTGGEVKMQVFLSEEGQPKAIKLVEGVHPVLDESAMRAATQMEWRPAYLKVKGEWKAVPSWTRYSLTFAPS